MRRDDVRFAAAARDDGIHKISKLTWRAGAAGSRVLRADRRGVRASRRHPVEHGPQRRQHGISAVDDRQQWQRNQSGRNNGPGTASGSRHGRRPGHIGSVVTTLAAAPTPSASSAPRRPCWSASRAGGGRARHRRRRAGRRGPGLQPVPARLRAVPAERRPAARSSSISELFAELVEAALRAARLTDGDVDPTCGQALAEIGYDRDFAVLQAAGERSPRPAARRVWPCPAGAACSLTARGGLAQLANGAQLDLGATAKAWAADRCAEVIAARPAAACWSASAGTSRWPGRRRPMERHGEAAGGCGSPTTTPPGRTRPGRR